jgi:hypothetical protein
LYIAEFPNSATIPFWWNGFGEEEEIVRQVLEKAGNNKEAAGLLLSEGYSIASLEFAQVISIGDEASPIAFPITLKEKGEVAKKRTVKGQLLIYPADIGIHLDGYKQAGTMEEAESVVIELWEDHVKAHVWADKDSEDPTVVDLEGARS